MSFKQNFDQFVEKQVEAAVDLMFANAHGYAMTDSGDITPEQAFKLDEIKNDLKELIITQTLQNLTEEQKSELNLIHE